MQAFTQHKGLVVPLDRSNVDTDAIIPKQYLKSIKRTGFGPTLFDDWRYLEPGDPGMDHALRKINPDFVLNQARYQGASILLAQENFGCGSSREHAVWALSDFGIRAVIAPSFADIFYNNAFKNGLLPIVLKPEQVARLFQWTTDQCNYQLMIDLSEQVIALPNGETWAFEVDAFRKHCLMNGLDDIGLTLQCIDEIKAYEAKRRQITPWLFD